MRAPTHIIIKKTYAYMLKMWKTNAVTWQNGILLLILRTISKIPSHKGMTIKEVIDALERFAPLSLQEDYDNAGLQVGLTEADISGVLLCLDVTPEVLREASELGCNLVVSHHPLIFRGLKQLCDQNMVAECVRMALQQGITIYSAHTNLDNAPGGVNYRIASLLGAKIEGWLQPISGKNGGSGVVCTLPEAMEPKEFMLKVKKVFGIHTLCTNFGPSERKIKRIGICGGSGDFLLNDAVRFGCDCFLTGEMHYHQYFGYESKLHIGVMGHYQSEQFTIDLLGEIVENALPGAPLHKYSRSTNPICYL